MGYPRQLLGTLKVEQANLDGKRPKTRSRYPECQKPECQYPECQEPEYQNPECQNPENQSLLFWSFKKFQKNFQNNLKISNLDV